MCGCGGRKLSNSVQAPAAPAPAPNSGQSTGARVVQSQAFTGGAPLPPVSTQGRVTLPRPQV